MNDSMFIQTMVITWTLLTLICIAAEIFGDPDDVVLAISAINMNIWLAAGYLYKK